MKRKLFFEGIFFLFVCVASLNAQQTMNVIPPIIYDCATDTKDFPVVDTQQESAVIRYDADDYKGVIRAISDLQKDIERVTDVKINTSANGPLGKYEIMIGTLGKSKVIDELVTSGKIKLRNLQGKWESFIITTVDNPKPGIRQGLIIAGSDKRGTIYGIYELSQQLGVSPWYWWADAPIQKRQSAYVKSGYYESGEPKVKYRGIFINDEWPSFGNWATEKFGGVNSKMYVHLFELLLRLKANFFWPAMWASAFNEDDPMNPILADEYGIVMGTSHHEPMMRAHKEYTRRKGEVGPWDYKTNKERLDNFFREGMERNKEFENVVTIGMRGDGDVAMSEEGDEANMQVLKKVIEGQRQTLKEVYGKEPSEIPQLWAIFTEVQRYYDAGFTVPDDVMLLFCDNNWGYIRRTGPDKEKKRKGGMGLYYHIDMNGGPWNDRWVTTTTVPKLREQLHLAYQSGIDDLWVINVGDIKPKELPIDFIMRYAWNPEAISAEKTGDYMIEWAQSIFGTEYAKDIADIVSKYTKYNLLRKAEVQLPDVFSVVNYHEADRMLAAWKELTAKAEELEHKLSPEAKDAYYQLVLYPVKASAGVAEIYLSVGKNRLYAKQGRISTNDYATRAKELFNLDWYLSNRYNNETADGKWKHMMSDKHIGYTKWYMPENNELPELSIINPLGIPTPGIAVEGSEAAWPLMTEHLSLPVFDALNNQTYYVEVFNRGVGEFEYTVLTSQPWIKVDKTKGKVAKENRMNISIDWSKAPQGTTEGVVEIVCGKHKAEVKVPIVNGTVPDSKEAFFGTLSDSEFSIPAYAYNANIPGRQAKWSFIPDLGREKGNMGIVPATASSTLAHKSAARLEYKVYLPSAGKTTIALGILPTQDVNPARGLRIAIGIDGKKPVVLDARKGFVDTFGEYNPKNLALSKVLKPLPERSTLALSGKGKNLRNEVFDNMRWLDVELEVDKPGFHTLKVYMVDPEVVLEKIVVNPDNNRPSYFGAPSKQHNAATMESTNN